MTGIRTPSSDRITILNVDDDPAFSELVATYLERLDDRFEVRTAENPRTALRIVDEEHVDCVVSDFDMPEFDGLELLESVREKNEDLPFILFTGKGSEAIASRAISAGVTDYLQKASGTEQYEILANRIRNAVSETEANQQMDRAFEAIDAAQEGISLLDDDGTFIYVNDTYCDITGYDRAELVGEHWHLLAQEDLLTQFDEEIVPALEATDYWQGETTYVRKDDRPVVVDHVVSYTNDGSMVCLISDAFGTEAHGTPEGGARLLDEALDAMEDIFVVLDEDGKLLRANRRFTEVTGYSIEELSEMDRTDLVRDEDVGRLEAYLHERNHAGRAKLRASLVTKDGQAIPYELRTREMTDTYGETIGYVASGRDVSEQRRRERQLERQASQFESFAEVLAHDLRNPLTVASGRVREALETGSTEHLEAADNALSNLDKAIDNLAEAMQEGSIAESTTRVQLASVFEDALSSVGFDDARLSVDPDLFVNGDACAITRLAENLLSNAVDHAGPSPSVRVGALPNGFFVEDDGPGIPEGEHETVFDPGRTSKPDEGGYGLVSVRQIALAHGWSVRVAEGTDGGARFEFTDVALKDQTADHERADSAV
ncbi:MAG: PAS domain S-box protein [Halopenitus sp.]